MFSTTQMLKLVYCLFLLRNGKFYLEMKAYIQLQITALICAAETDTLVNKVYF